MTNPPTPGALRAAREIMSDLAKLTSCEAINAVLVIKAVAAIIDREMPTAELLAALHTAATSLRRLADACPNELTAELNRIADNLRGPASILQQIDTAIVDRETGLAELVEASKSVDKIIDDILTEFDSLLGGLNPPSFPHLPPLPESYKNTLRRHPSLVHLRNIVTKVAQVESRDMDRGRETESTPAPKVPSEESARKQVREIAQKLGIPYEENNHAPDDADDGRTD